MYMSIGGEIVVKASELVAILDLNVYAESEQNNIDMHSGKEVYKSVVITTDQMYYSPLSSSTLQKRLDSTHINKHNFVFE